MENYEEKFKRFNNKYHYQVMDVNGISFKYLLVGSGKTIVLLNGGMNISCMWMDYIDLLSNKYQVLSFDYPLGLNTDKDLIIGMHEFFTKLGLTNLTLVGASFGGYVLQMYASKFKENVEKLILISTGGLDEKTIKSYRLKKYVMPLVLWYLKRCNYEKFKNKLIKFGVSEAKTEPKELQAYAKEMFKVLFRDYTKEKDLHITGLINDLFNQKAITKADFSYLKGNILLILPTADFFSKKDQENLILIMHEPVFKYISGGHLSTLLKSNEYIKVIEEFLGEEDEL